MIERYWRTAGGGLFLEFRLVRKSPDSSPRYLDALIVAEMPEQERRWSEAVAEGYTTEEVVGGRSVIAVQAKHDPPRLSMGLLGQTLFAVELLRRLKPASVRGVALCRQDDAALRAVFESFPNMSVAVDVPLPFGHERRRSWAERDQSLMDDCLRSAKSGVLAEWAEPLRSCQLVCLRKDLADSRVCGLLARDRELDRVGPTVVLVRPGR